MVAVLQRRKDRLAARKAARQRVSAGIEAWLDSDEPTTLGTLNDAFGEKILAAACLVLMAPSALPIPTAGATHVFSVIAVLFAVQMVMARREAWLPKRWERRELGRKTQKGLRFIVRQVKRAERISKPRLAALMRGRPGEVVLGAVILAFTLAAMFSPPFSGLDTLPALGVVLIALGILLEDVVFAIAGMIVGVGGVTLMLTVGSKAMDVIFGATTAPLPW